MESKINFIGINQEEQGGIVVDPEVMVTLVHIVRTWMETELVSYSPRPEIPTEPISVAQRLRIKQEFRQVILPKYKKLVQKK